MGKDINKWVGVARLTADPQLSETGNGTEVCSFSIASNNEYIVNGEKKSQVSFFNCVAWKNLAKVVSQYCKKGSRVAIVGKLNQRSYEKDGVTKRVFEIVVEELQFLDNKTREANNQDAKSEVKWDDNPFS